MDDGIAKSCGRDERRQGIIEVARHVFMTEGFAEASMSAIAARVGGSKGTLYNYFPSKQELFAAVIQDDCERKQAILFDSLPVEGEDMADVFREVGRRYTHLVLSDQVVQLSRVVIAESVRFPELGRVMYEAGPKRGRARMAVYVDKQIKAGRLRDADAIRIVDQFCDMCLGGLYRQRLMNVIAPPGAEEVDANVEFALQVILAAYGPPGEAG